MILWREDDSINVAKGKLVFGFVAIVKAIGLFVYVCFALIRLAIQLHLLEYLPFLVKTFNIVIWFDNLQVILVSTLLIYVVRFLTILHQ